MSSGPIPDPALVVLVGPSGSGKSTWAAARYRPAEIVSSDQLRGRTSAAAFARAHHAGTAADQLGRYRLLAERGVRTVFVALADLARPEDLLKLAPITAAFAT